MEALRMTARWLVLSVFSASALLGCGMRSTLETDVDGIEVSDVDAGGGAGTNGSMGAPCGHGGTCDPQNLGGETCELLGAGKGTLSCDPVTCTFDLSLCTGTDIGTGVGNGSGSGDGTGNNGQGGTGTTFPNL